jgi:hypothetical protein
MADVIDFDLSKHLERFGGKGAGIGTDPDQWTANSKAFQPSFDATMHIVTNLVHEVDGDTARSQCFAVGHHYLNNDAGDRHFNAAMHSTYGSIRTADGWKIKSLYLKPLFYEGNTSLFALAGEKQRKSA